MLSEIIGWMTALQKYTVLIKRNRELKIIQAYDFSRKVEQHEFPKQGGRSIVFIIPGMPAYSGGHTSILRLGTNLYRRGHEVTYVSYERESVERMKRNARLNFRQFEGRILPVEGLDRFYDIGIATTWLSAYYLYRYQHQFLHKAYFVQDFEPAFHAEGDLFWLSLNTYRMGLHLISLGHWNKKRIEGATECREVDCIDFPFENKQYPMIFIPKNPVKRVKIAVYFKLDTKRGPHILMQALELLASNLAEKGKKCEFFFFGLPKYLKLSLGQNVGQLSHHQLRKLYQSCDLGIVGSFSNISLVDYEMIASSLPVVEFKDGSAPSFFQRDHMILAETNPLDFVRSVMPYIQNPNLLNAMIKRAQEAIVEKTWEAASAQFSSILGLEDTWSLF